MKYYLGTSLFNVNQPIFLTQWGYHSHGESRNLSPLGNASPARGWWHRCSAWSADNSQADSMLSSSSWPEAGWAWAKTLLKSTTGNTPLGSTVPEQAETRSFRPTSGISNGSQRHLFKGGKTVVNGHGHDENHGYRIRLRYLVGGWATPLKIWLRQLGWWHSQLNRKIKNVPNHQPVYIILSFFAWRSLQTVI